MASAAPSWAFDSVRNPGYSIGLETVGRAREAQVKGGGGPGLACLDGNHEATSFKAWCLTGVHSCPEASTELATWDKFTERFVSSGPLRGRPP